ncbi:MAG TPA: hypothetical protein VFE54_04525 [Mucilaginibacter sp.]|jgi:hypothetical protein|nr:hypothetical protein [Mucilaginibacter sp.]
MSQYRRDWYTGVSKYLLIFAVSACLIGMSPKAFAQADTTARRERPQPPPHPKPPSLKEIVNKINIFKKHKDDPQPVVTPAPVKQTDPAPPAPAPPPPGPAPQPDAVKPKTPVKHTTTKKKTKKATGTKKPAAPKPTQPLI